MNQYKFLTIIFTTLLFVVYIKCVPAQNITINGYLKDNMSGEALIGGNIYDSASYKGTISNEYGFYSLSLPKGQHTITYSFIGYSTQKITHNFTGDTTINMALSEGQTLREVVVTADKRSLVESPQMSTHKVEMIDLKKMPALMGEVDIMKGIQKLPGVQSGNEGSTGVYVRGGSPGQNLILLDGVPVYNVNHLFGFFSVFNADAINNVKVIKGGFPARYGGRLSSVIDIRMKEGNMKKYRVEGAVGLLSTKLTVSGPIIKDKTSFIVSGRRSYFDVFMRAFTASMDEYAGFWFGDLNAKINHKFSDKDRIYLSAYTGEDKFYFGGDYGDDISEDKFDFGLKWGNITSALRWNHVFNGKLFSNTTVTYSRFRFDNELSMTYKSNLHGAYFDYNQSYVSGVNDFAVKTDMDYYPTPMHQIKFGMDYIYHTYTPGVSYFRARSSEAADTTIKGGSTNTYAHEFAAFIEDNWEINDIFKTNVGLRFSNYYVNDRSYRSLEPRFSLRSKLTPDFSVKTSVAFMKQYIHLLSNTSISLPTDLWVPATDNVPPQESWQYALGGNWLAGNDWKLSLEAYYKDMTNVIAYKEGAYYAPADKNWETKVASGRGWSYGAEFFTEKSWKNTKISLAYTLSWTYRQFDEINDGDPYPFKYDRRHDINLSFTHQFSENFDVGFNWMYATGVAFTIPFEYYQSPNIIFDGYYGYEENVTYFESRNNYRAPAYHRLDVGVNFHKKKKWGTRTWSLSLLNAYGRYNPVIMMVDDGESGKVLRQYTLFRFVPSVSYRFKFN